jgi:hypothetical protein
MQQYEMRQTAPQYEMRQTAPQRRSVPVVHRSRRVLQTAVRVPLILVFFNGVFVILIRIQVITKNCYMKLM